jgi:hypothetical protein
MKKTPLAIHGDTGTILKDLMTTVKQRAYKGSLQNALNAGYQIKII